MHIIWVLILIFLSSCSFCNSELKNIPNNIPENSIIDNIQDNNQENITEDKNTVSFQADKISVDYAIKNGKLIWIGTLPHGKPGFLESIDNVVDVFANRFAFLENGDVVDLYGRTPEEIKKEVIDPETPNYDTLKEVTLSTVKYLHQNIGIKKFEDPAVVFYVIRANDGNVYYLDTLANLESTVRVQKDILTADGKIHNERFPETESWENVVDYRSCEDFIIALTSDGKVLSSGIEFSVENAIKINIVYFEAQRIPAALTADGKLVFGEIKEDYSNIYGTTSDRLQKYYQELRDCLAQAENFTEIIDFTYSDGNMLVILAQKADGSLIATTNDIYNPEYVSQPE